MVVKNNRAEVRKNYLGSFFFMQILSSIEFQRLDIDFFLPCQIDGDFRFLSISKYVTSEKKGISNGVCRQKCERTYSLKVSLTKPHLGATAEFHAFKWRLLRP